MWSIKLDVCAIACHVRRGTKYFLCEALKVVYYCVTLSGSSSPISSRIKYLPVKHICVVPNGLESFLQKFSHAVFLLSKTLCM